MAKFELKLPKMGESVAEATITSWLKQVGDVIEADEAVVEIATDKVDSEVPSEVDGVLIEILFNVDDIVQVGETIAVIEIEGEIGSDSLIPVKEISEVKESALQEIINIPGGVLPSKEANMQSISSETRFYSPLVKNIAKKEGVLQNELDAILGTGNEGRVTKKDILTYVKNRVNDEGKRMTVKTEKIQSNGVEKTLLPISNERKIISSGDDEIIEMSRMGKLVSKHMVDSVNTSVHVQSFIEADVTKIWNWRNSVKGEFKNREGENLTFTPIFMEAVAKALRDYPMMNISVQGDSIIKKKNINLGMAAALEDGNLIVPVIKNADQLNLIGMTREVNDLANRARLNQLKPDDVQGGTYTVTNVGTFGSIMGTPIINQPQVGILALGAIRKVPAVIETNEGDFIGIRYKMFMSHSYDHRVVNGALGGQFVKAIKDYLEAWNIHREI